MSSGEDDYGVGSRTKKRRIQRACDACRRKKIRCDSATNSSSHCSNCTSSKIACTYIEVAKKRGPPKGYVESLETRLQKMENYLQELCPGADFTQELGVYMDRETWHKERHKGDNISQASDARKSQPASPGIHVSNANSDELGVNDEDPAIPALSEELKRLTVTSLDRRFHGKSSGLVLVQTAIGMKREHIGGDIADSYEAPPKRPEFWAHPEGRRTRAPGDKIKFEFPPPDLTETLISLYFFRNNLYLPVLHRPTFERQHRERLYEIDRGFACILLLVCAIGSRWIDDPRVLRRSPQDGKDGPSQQSAGWKYFDQLHMQSKSLISPATLFDLQQYALAGIFLQSATAPYTSWVIVGTGLRVAQDVGAHRKKASDSPATVEDELWKRAFWVLVNLDRLGSSALGRPCAIHDEDFDLDLPLEVDDEYWESSNKEEAFVQPPDRPSTVAYFIALMKLDQILSFALRTIYSINKSKILLGFVGSQWEQDTVTELDSALKKWINSVPGHLRWDPTQDFSISLQQSAILYATYHHIRILVHRPFIPSPRKPALLSFPSLSICTDAARSCSHVLEVQRTKCGVGPAPHLKFYAFTSGLVLLLNIWDMRKPDGTMMSSIHMPMQHAHMCMKFLKAAEEQWQLAGRLHDILYDLASIGEFPLPARSPEISNKRQHGSYSPKLAPTSEFSVPTEPATHPRPIMHPQSLISRHGSSQLPMAEARRTDFEQMTLPMNSADLDRIPLNPDFVHQQGGPPRSGNVMPGMPWFPPRPELRRADQSSSFESPTDVQPVPQLFGLVQDGQQSYPAPVVPFVTGFPQQQEQGPPPNAWGSTLDMWSTAPTGFEWEDWGTFTTNMLPGPSNEQNPPS